MKLTGIFLILMLVVATMLWLLPTPENSNPERANSYVLGPVRIFDGEEVINARYIEVRDGRIRQLYIQSPQSDLPQIDGENQWLMPGLIDAHVHAWGEALTDSLGRGVTTGIDMFGQPEYLRQRQPLREANTYTREADMFGAGLLVTAPQGHGTQYGINVSTMSSADQAPELVEERLTSGSDFIKIVYTSSEAAHQHAPSISKAELAAAIEAAHAHEKLAVVHVSDHQSAVDAVATGADGLVHSFFDRRISDALLTDMVESGTFVIPTMIVYEGMLQGTKNDEILFNNPDIEVNRSARNTLTQRFGGAEFPPEYYDNLLWNSKAMHEAGVALLAGSDAPNPNTAYGWSLILELIMMAEAGIPPEAVLRAATSYPAKQFGLSDRGHISIGAKADFLLLGESPLEDLMTLLQPLAIWKNGYPVHSSN